MRQRTLVSKHCGKNFNHTIRPIRKRKYIKFSQRSLKTKAHPQYQQTLDKDLILRSFKDRSMNYIQAKSAMQIQPLIKWKMKELSVARKKTDQNINLKLILKPFTIITSSIANAA